MLINERHAEFSLVPEVDPVRTGDTLLLFKGNDVLLKTVPEKSRLPVWEEVAGMFADIMPRHAFSQGGRRVFIADMEEACSAPPGFAWESARVFRTLSPAMDGALLNIAYHLSAWYGSHRFCGACGGTTRPARTERALTCQRCGLTVYPAILPAIIVAVLNGDRLLLARNARGAFRHFSLLAGFVEAGETAEQTVSREVLEEVNLRVKNIRYIASQPWGISQSLMLGFTTELDGPADIKLQENELAEARWFAREEIPKNDSTASIAFDLMERFRVGQL